MVLEIHHAQPLQRVQSFEQQHSHLIFVVTFVSLCFVLLCLLIELGVCVSSFASVCSTKDCRRTFLGTVKALPSQSE